MEDNYFDLENRNNKRILDLEIINKEKSEEKEYIDCIYNVYENHNIESYGIHSLRQLEKKVLKSLNQIREKKTERNIFIK